MKKTKNLVACAIYVITIIVKTMFSNSLLKETSIPVILEDFYVPLLFFFISQILYLSNITKNFTTLDMVLPIILAFITSSYSFFRNMISYNFSSNTASLIELYAFFLILVVTEICAGRKSRLELYSAGILSISVVLGIFIIPQSSSSPLNTCMRALGFIMVVFANSICKQIFLLSCNPVIFLLVYSLSLTFKGSLNFASHELSLFKQIHMYMACHIFESSVLLFAMCFNFISDLYIFKNLDLEYVFAAKLVALLLTLVAEYIKPNKFN
jgi:hypothetical protein